MDDKIQQSFERERGDILHAWTVPEYRQYERGKWWYIVAAAILIILVGYGIASLNFLFVLILLLFAAVIFMHSTREPLPVNVGVATKGIILNDRFFPYENLEAFWVINDPPVSKNVYFKFVSSIRPPLPIHLADEDAEELRRTLQRFLFEDTTQKDEPLSELLWKMLKL